jgi:hypothetical protein
MRKLDDEFFFEHMKVVPTHGSDHNSSIPMHINPEVAYLPH